MSGQSFDRIGDCVIVIVIVIVFCSSVSVLAGGVWWCQCHEKGCECQSSESADGVSDHHSAIPQHHFLMISIRSNNRLDR